MKCHTVAHGNKQTIRKVASQVYAGYICPITFNGGSGDFSEPFGGEPQLGPPDVMGFAEEQQMTGGMGKGIIENIKDTLMP